MAKLNPGVFMFRIFGLFLLVSAFPHLASASDKMQPAQASDETSLIVLGKPISASLSSQQESLPSNDNRVTYNVKMRVVEIIQGEYKKKYLDVAVQAHNKESVMHNNFIVIGKNSNDDKYHFQSFYVRRISCISENQDIPEKLVYHVRYSRAPEGVQNDCIIF